MAQGLLAKHSPSAHVACGVGGVRNAWQLTCDVRKVAELIGPQRASGDILVVCRDRYLFAVGLLAAWSRGWAVCLPPNAQPELIRDWSRRPDTAYLLHDVDESLGIDLRLVLDTTQLQDKALPGGDKDQDRFEVPWNWAELNNPGRRLASVWTSGSTGQHQRHDKYGNQLLGEALMLARHFQLSFGTRVVSTVPSFHIYGLLFSVLLPLVSGAAFVRETPLHPETIAAALQRDGSRCLISVPTHLRMLVSLQEGSIVKVDRVFSSGAPLSRELANSLWSLHGLSITEILGSTETGGIAWRVVPHRDSNWRPLSDVAIEPGQDGQLAIISPFLPRDVQLPYLTEERVRWHEDGSFSHLGRKDDIVKIAGKRISIQEVETRLIAIEGVRDAVVRVQPDSLRGQTLWALVVAPGKSRSDLRAELLNWIDPVGVPRRIRLVEKIERNANGKLPREQFLQFFTSPTEQSSSPSPDLVLTQNSSIGEGQTISLSGQVPTDFFYFQGHFDIFPLLPGVVQLSTAIKYSRDHWPQFGDLRRVLRLKFRQPIRPGTQLDLTLERGTGDGQINFEFSCAKQALSYGILEFAEVHDERELE